MNCEDADASMVTAPPAHRPGPVDGDRQRAAPSSSTSAPSAAQRVEHRAHRAHPGLRVAVEVDRPVGQRGHRRQEPHDRAGQPAVDRDAAAQRLRRA